jgi:hypothetical protein
MCLVHIIYQIHHFFNVSKKLIYLFIIAVEGSLSLKFYYLCLLRINTSIGISKLYEFEFRKDKMVSTSHYYVPTLILNLGEYYKQTHFRSFLHYILIFVAIVI